MNTTSSLQAPPGQPAPAARRPRRVRRPGLLRRTALAATVLAGTGALLLSASGVAFATVDQTASQWAEVGPWGYTGDQSSQVTAVYTIQNVAEPGTEMLEDNNDNMNNGGTIDVWTRYNQNGYQDPKGTGPYGLITQANYLWEFVPSNPGDGGSIVDGSGELINRQSGLCLDVANNTGDGAVVDQWACNGGPNQQWTAVAVAGTSGYSLLPESDGVSGFLGVGNGASCSPQGDGDSVYVRTTGIAHNTCDQWDIQQASYDFATHPVTVGGALGNTEVDNRGYECVPGDKVRLNAVEWSDGWDFYDLSQPGADGGLADIDQYPPSYVPGGSVTYSKTTVTGSPVGQLMLYCDPPATTP